MYSSIDIALLNSEWAGGKCPTCGEPPQPGTHKPGCEHDLALGERAFSTIAERNAARRRIAMASGPTLPPPA